jgi:hypothetical protein
LVRAGCLGDGGATLRGELDAPLGVLAVSGQPGQPPRLSRLLGLLLQRAEPVPL